MQRARSVFARCRGRVTLLHGRVRLLNPEYFACRALLVYESRGRKLWHPKPAPAPPNSPAAPSRWAYCFHGFLLAGQGIWVSALAQRRGARWSRHSVQTSRLAVYLLPSAGWGVTSLGYSLNYSKASFPFLPAARAEGANPALALPPLGVCESSDV